MTIHEDIVESHSVGNGDKKGASSSGTYEALQAEYKHMASWYDSFWGDYSNKTFRLPLKMVQLAIRARINNQQGDHGHKNIATNQEKTVVVDVGSGTGEFLMRLARRLGVMEYNTTHTIALYGVEPSPEMLAQAKKKTQPATVNNDGTNAAVESPTTMKWIESPAESLPFKSGTVDVICSTNAFHFFRNRPLALKHMHRILKPSLSPQARPQRPCLIITDWCADYWMVRLYHWMEYLRWNILGRYLHRYPGPLGSKDLKYLVQAAGFDQVHVETYIVRVFGFCFWGMQTVTAQKP